MGSPMVRTRADRTAVQLTIYVAEPHIGNRKSKVDDLLRRAAAAGVAGGTVLAACEGFGRRHSHVPTFWHRADETPLTVIFVDVAEHIDRLLLILDEVLPDAVATVKTVRAVQYARPPRPGSPGHLAE